MPPAPSRKNIPRAAEGSPSVTLRPSGEVAFEKEQSASGRRPGLHPGDVRASGAGGQPMARTVIRSPGTRSCGWPPAPARQSQQTGHGAPPLPWHLPPALRRSVCDDPSALPGETYRFAVRLKLRNQPAADGEPSEERQPRQALAPSCLLGGFRPWSNLRATNRHKFIPSNAKKHSKQTPDPSESESAGSTLHNIPCRQRQP